MAVTTEKQPRMDTLYGGGGTREGTIAEHRALAKLLSLGLDIAIPAVDDGHDFIAYADGKALTIQVKSHRGRNLVLTRDYGQGRYEYRNYVFNCKRKWQSDIYLLCGVEEELWWVVPGERVRKQGIQNCLAIYPGKKIKQQRNRTGWTDEYLDAWHLIGEMLV